MNINKYMNISKIKYIHNMYDYIKYIFKTNIFETYQLFGFVWRHVFFFLDLLLPLPHPRCQY